MAPKTRKRSSVVNKGSWTADEDKRLADYIQQNGAKKWKTVALKAGLNRCGKSCRLRWLNYLRPNIKRGNISPAEEDLILRLHKLLGNRWSLIAGRIPGRTDNEIKNYWNSHLSKQVNQEGIKVETPDPIATMPQTGMEESREEAEKTGTEEGKGETVGTSTTEESAGNAGNEEIDALSFDVDDLFDFSAEGTFGLDWVSEFLAGDDEFGY